MPGRTRSSSNSSTDGEKELAALFRWLAGVLAGDDPAAEWQQLDLAVLPPPIASRLERLGSTIDPADAGQQQQREAERVRLLENAPGGAPLPPYGSWWLEHRLQGETTTAVAEIYRRQGVSHGSGPADYLPTELELIQLLLRHQLAARVTGEQELAEHARVTEARFLETLVLPWVGQLCAAGRAASSDPFWLGFFDLLEHSLTTEQGRIAAAGEVR